MLIKGRLQSVALACILLMLLGVPRFSGAQAQAQSGDLKALARSACAGVGEVRHVSSGVTGAPILVLEEYHLSRVGQLQHAITLTRLHDRYGLRHLVLEGYLKEDPEIKTDWFISAAQGLNRASRTRVAVRLLREGEISSAEFAKLIYWDFTLHPGETRDEYMVELPSEAEDAPLRYLLRIAEQSLRSEHAARVQQLQEDIKRLTGQAQRQKIDEWLDYIFSVDAWAQSQAKILRDNDPLRAVSDVQHLALVEGIIRRAQERAVQLQPAERTAMDRHSAYWRGRVKASETMVRTATALADRQDVSVVVMLVGASHTAGIARLLMAAQRPFAVITPLSLTNREEKGDLAWDMFERKHQGGSVYLEGWTARFLKIFPPATQKKPKPVVQQEWLQAKAQLYLFTSRIARWVLNSRCRSGGGGPSCGGPPYGFLDDEFRRRLVYVDPQRIVIVPDDEQSQEGQVVLFPVTFYPTDLMRRTEIWVKAGLGTPLLEELEQESAESMLQKALEEVRLESKTPKSVEDQHNRVQIDVDTVATFGFTETEVRKRKLFGPS